MHFFERADILQSKSGTLFPKWRVPTMKSCKIFQLKVTAYGIRENKKNTLTSQFMKQCNMSYALN